MSEALWICRGCGEKNLERTISSPVSQEDVKKILEKLEEENQEDSDTYRFIKSNENEIFVWGTPNHTRGKKGFDKLKDEGEGEYMYFYGDGKHTYIGIVSHVNDIGGTEAIDNEINKFLSETFWPNDKGKLWTHIWFLKNVKTVSSINDPMNHIRNTLNWDGIFKHKRTNEDGQKRTRIFESNQDSIARLTDEIDKINSKDLQELIDSLKSDSTGEQNIVPINDRVTKSYVHELLENKKQVILYGPPGTGKTFISKEIATDLLIKDDN